MTQNETIRQIRALGLSCVVVLDGELRVSFPGRNSEPSAYYTDDREDALWTARAMVKARDDAKLVGA